MFLRADFAFNRASQQQTFIFSNAVDLNISNTTTHTVPHFTLDWSLGRDFPLNNGTLFQFELGLSSAFTTGIGLYENRLRQSGSFISSYSDEDNHTSGLAYKEYNYEIEYQRPNLFGAFARIGWQIPVNHHFLTFGVLAKAKRLYYQNFIVLSSDTYSAIANSRSQSSSFGVFVSYQFGKKIDN
jgi:hypothetical protein